MKHKKLLLLLCFSSNTLWLTGCVTAVTTVPEQAPPPEPERIVHTVIANPPTVCGPLDEFMQDSRKLGGEQISALLSQLTKNKEDEFSCDRLKTGLLYSQIGKTVDEDDLAIEILLEYQNSEKLNDSETRLIELLIQHSKDRKRLHVLLKQLGDKLIAEQALSETMSTDLLTLQQKLNQLQKIEADINETEQSISTPTSSSLNTDGAENTGS